MVTGPSNSILPLPLITLLFPTYNEPSGSIVIAPLALTLKIGTPDESETANRSPVKSSVIENNWPLVPWISKIVDPEVEDVRVNLSVNSD